MPVDMAVVFIGVGLGTTMALVMVVLFERWKRRRL